MGRDEKVVQKIEEDAPFEIPNFDEKDFIRKELISFRTTAILFVFAIVVATITFVLWEYAGLTFPLLLLVALVLAVSLRFIFKAAKIDISHWKRREWTGTMFMFFFFWLGFFLLLANPPFTDAASPAVDLRAVPAAQSPGQPVMLGAYIADSTALADGSPRFCVRPYTGDAPPALAESEFAGCADPWERLEGKPFWTKEEIRPAGKYVAYAVAEDENGQREAALTTFEVGSPFSGPVFLPDNNRLDRPDKSILVRVHPSVKARTVQFSLDAGATWSHFIPDNDPVKRADNYWRAEASYEGWKAGTHNVTLRVVPQPEYVRGADHKLWAPAPDPSGPYLITVDPALPQLGTLKVNGGKGDYPETPYFNPGQTPGIEAPLALLAIAGLALAGRRRGA